MAAESVQRSAQACFQPAAPSAQVQACEASGPTTGLGADVDAFASRSPTLRRNLELLLAKGWKVQYGSAGAGSYCTRKDKIIVIDEGQKNHPEEVVQTLSHESGHALYTPDPYVTLDGLSKPDYVARNVNRLLKDEGEATLMNAQVRQEILNNGGADIGIAGAQAAKYEQLAAQYPAAADRDVARQEIADLFADGEHPSTSPDETYREYYSKVYSNSYDKDTKRP
jgi:type VI secretion system secreted protein VgrG